jgi:nucleotide-binding universal stress UspA family protein
MFASILLPLTEGPEAVSAWDYAFWLAREKGGHIEALAVIDIKSFEIPVLGTADGFMPSVVSPPIAESQALMDELAKAARMRLERFAQTCAVRGVSCATEVKTGIPGEVIAREAVAHDIVVMSRTGNVKAAKGETRGVDPLISSVIRGSIRPVLVAGKKFPASGDVNNVIVAFDGSNHAARALTNALMLCRGFGLNCTLMVVAPTEDAGREIVEPAEAFLRHHGLRPGKKIVIGSKPSELLCDVVSAEGSDILVMGAYGHSPIREMIFGCTTERVLSHCDAAVILQS